MSTRVDVEEIAQTTSEKALAVVLGIFVFVGAVWGYVKLAEVDRPERQIGRNPVELLDPEARSALDRQQSAEAELRQARSAEEAATRELVLRREEYRTALDAGQSAGALRQAYAQAQEQLAQAEARTEQAAAELSSAQPAARAARGELQQALVEQNRSMRDAAERHDRTVLLLRLALILGLAVLSIWLIAVLRSRRSRYLPLPLATLVAAALLAVALAADYAWDDITEISDVGPLLLSVAGSAITIAGFAALQRHLTVRIPIRRVDRGECPFCGFRTSGPHCEGCGRPVVAECAHCHASRRVGSPHCATCGRA